MTGIAVASPLNLGNDTAVCDTALVVLDAGQGFQTYTWSTGDTASAMAFSAASIGPGSHTFTISAVDSNGCGAADTIVITVINCTNGLGENMEGIRIYPNPTNGILQIETSCLGDLELRVFDNLGRLIGQDHVTESPGYLDLSALPTGLYLRRAMGCGVCRTFRIERT